MRRITLLVVICATALTGYSQTINMAGNWQFSASSTVFGLEFSATGQITQSGNNLGGQLTIVGSPCAASATFTGTLISNVLTMTVNEGGQAVIFSGTVSPDGNSANGTYATPSGGCTNGDMGTWTGYRVVTPSGPAYWSPTPPDCSSLGTTFGQPVQLPNGGYSCYVSGTFVWLAAGGEWGTTIRVAAPASNPVGVDYKFYDASGNALSLDTTINNGAAASGDEVTFALYANQPAELEMLGATSDAGTGYSNTATGTVYATFYCPDATTCSNVLPQLMYSALPSYPWSLSVPIAWDDALSYQWSAEGIDDGSTHIVSLVIFNPNETATTYNVYIYDSNGNLAATGTTPPIPGFNSVTGEAGTYGVVLSQVVSPLPSGIFKVLVDGGSMLSAVEMLQVNGPSATTLRVAYDTAPGSTPSARTDRRQSVKRLRAAATPKTIFPALPKD